MDTKKFETLLKVIECGNITKAGEELGYTQSGISHMIKTLEGELGFPLLTRSKSGVIPTGDGEEMIPILRKLVYWNEQFEQTAASIRGITSGSVKIGTYTSMSVHFLPAILKAFQRDFPRITIELTEGGNQSLAYGIENNLIDLGFGNNLPGLNADWIPLIDDCLVAVLPLSCDTAETAFPIAAFHGAPFIALAKDFDCEVQKVFHDNGVSPDIKFTSTDDYTIIAMVEQGLGYSILPRMVTQGYRHCKVRTLPLNPFCRRQLGIVLPSLSTASPATKKFIEYVKSAVPNIPVSTECKS